MKEELTEADTVVPEDSQTIDELAPLRDNEIDDGKVYAGDGIYL